MGSKSAYLRLNNEDVKKMTELRKKQNLTYAIIAERFSTTGQTVKKLIERYQKKRG